MLLKRLLEMDLHWETTREKDWTGWSGRKNEQWRRGVKARHRVSTVGFSDGRVRKQHDDFVNLADPEWTHPYCGANCWWPGGRAHPQVHRRRMRGKSYNSDNGLGSRRCGLTSHHYGTVAKMFACSASHLTWGRVIPGLPDATRGTKPVALMTSKARCIGTPVQNGANDTFKLEFIGFARDAEKRLKEIVGEECQTRGHGIELRSSARQWT